MRKSLVLTLLAIVFVAILAAPAMAQSYYIPGEFGKAYQGLHAWHDAFWADWKWSQCQREQGSGTLTELSSCYGYETDSSGNITGYHMPAWQLFNQRYGYAGNGAPVYPWGSNPQAASAGYGYPVSAFGYGYPNAYGGQQYGQTMPIGWPGQQYGMGQQQYGMGQQYQQGYPGGYGQMPYGGYQMPYGYGQQPMAYGYQQGGGYYPFVPGVGGSGGSPFYPPYYETPSLGVSRNYTTLLGIGGALGSYAATRNMPARKGNAIIALTTLAFGGAGALLDRREDQKKRRALEEYQQRMEEMQQRLFQMQQRQMQQQAPQRIPPQMDPSGPPAEQPMYHRPRPQRWINKTGYTICIQENGEWKVKNGDAFQVHDASPDPRYGATCEVLGGGCTCGFRLKFGDAESFSKGDVYDVVCKR